MKSIVGKKVNMVEYFTAEGRAVPATLIETSPLVVTQVKTAEKDGYSAVQIGFGAQKESRRSRAVLGHTKGKAFQTLKEIPVEGEVKEGDTIDLSVFKVGDKVAVRGISKGKGFQGVVKRHGFHGGRRTHGQKHSEREPGSIGGGLRTRVPKGMRMAGRMGGDLIHVKNLEVVAIDEANNQLLVKGAVPGRRGTLVEIIG